MQFFKPSDIRTVECAVTNVTRNGFAFGTTEDGESVFIPARLAEMERIEQGDFLRCFCIDQTLDENRREGGPLSARYRTIRLNVLQRLSDVCEPKPVNEPIRAFTPPPAPVEPPAPPKPVMTPTILKDKAFAAMRDDDRAWSSRDLADHISFKFKDEYDLPEDMVQKVSAMMFAEHHAGRVASCIIRKERDQAQPSALYYALTTDTLIDLMENYEVADE